MAASARLSAATGEVVRIIPAILVTLVLVACGKPQETVIPSDASKWDAELGPVVKKLGEEEKRLFTAYVMRSKMAEAFGKKEAMPFGTTVGDAIASQQKFESDLKTKQEEEKQLKEKLLKEREAAAAAINGAVTVTLLAKIERPKNYDAGRYSETQLFKIGVLNKSDKTIAGVSGDLEFVDIFDKKVGVVGFSISEKIERGKDVVWTGSRDYNQFLEAHRAVWNLETGKFTTRFVPETIVYADGTKLSAEK